MDMNKAKLLIKQAIREVLKEELSVIIKTVMSETININTKSNAQITNESYTPKPARSRVHLESPIIPTQIDEVANNIKDGKFNVQDLQNFVTNEQVDDPLRGISGNDVDNFINKYIPK